MKSASPGEDPPMADRSTTDPKPSALKPSESLEIEIKLDAKPEDLDALWTMPPKGKTKRQEKDMVSRYFDSDDWRLRRRGYALRVRESGKKRVQTLKGGGETASGARQSREWTTPLDKPQPNLAGLGTPEVRAEIGLILSGELKERFRTEIHRRALTYGVKDSEGRRAMIEVALDQGRVVAGGKSQDICEIEFELVEGATTALFEEAHRLQAAFGFRFQPLTKAQRGETLIEDSHSASLKLPPPNFTKQVSLDQAFYKVCHACAAHWLANHAAVLDGRDIEGVHQMRVALRRLRSALSLFKRVLPEEDLAWLNRESKALITALGEARDWDVFTTELLAPLQKENQDPCLTVLRQACEAKRQAAYEAARETLCSPAYTAFVLSLGLWLEKRGWRRERTRRALRRPLIDLADSLLKKRHKAALKLGRSFENLPDADLHRLRIALKKLRYATEFFVTLYPKRAVRPYLEALKNLQNDLGRLNDVAVAETRLAGLCATPAAYDVEALKQASGLVMGWHLRELAGVRPELLQDWQSFAESETFWSKGKRT